MRKIDDGGTGKTGGGESNGGNCGHYYCCQLTD